MHRINITLVFFLIFTVISSALAYKIVISGYATYDYAYNDSYISQKHTTKDRIN